MDTYIPTESGHWVSEKYERLARVVKDYDPWLELRWIPPENRTSEDTKPYAVYDTKNNYIVFRASELDTPEGILSRLWSGDLTKHNPLAQLESMEAAQKAMELKEQWDKMEEANDLAAFFYQSPKNYIKHNGKKFDSERRRIE